MEPRRVLLPLRTIAAPADCTRPLLGSGRNRYVAAAPAWKRTPKLSKGPKSPLYLALSGPDVAAASALSYAAERPFYGITAGPFGCNCVAQNNKSRLSVTANKSCLIGWPFKIWSCCPTPYGTGQPVCAASTGRVLQPAPGAAAVMMRQRRNFGTVAPFFDNKPIFKYARLDGRDPQNRQSGNQKHRITKGSNSTDGGTAVTCPVSRTGGTELRLFHSWDLSVSRPTNRQVQSGPRRIKALRPAGFAARGALAHTSRPFLRPTNQPIYMNRPGAWVKRPGSGRSVIAEDFFITIRHHYDLRPVFRNRINNILRGRAIFSID